MYFIIKNVMLLSLLVFNVAVFAANAPNEIVEVGIEGTPSLIYISKSLNGKLHIKACDGEECPLLKLKITPETKAFFDNKPIPLSSKVNSTIEPGLMSYDVKTSKVLELHWYSS